MLVASRFGQGIGEALAAPAALGLLVVVFPDQGERTKALGIRIPPTPAWPGSAAPPARSSPAC